MRTALFLAPMLALPACGPLADNLDLPCAERRPAELTVGTGEDAFEPVAGVIALQFGPQGGAHLWLSVRTRSLGPSVRISYGVRDVATGMPLSQPGLQSITELVYNAGQEAHEAAGLYGYLNDVFVVPDEDGPVEGAGKVLYVRDLVGRRASLWAKVEDACKKPIKAEVEATIQGDAPR